mgnify:CR=1 FL=1
MCGEKAQLLEERFDSLGSPPRVRGKVCRGTLRRMRPRITPACAGKRCDKVHQAGAVQDHPRVCGEKFCSVHFSFFVRGSPPRVRGKGLPAGGLKTEYRITPACAGKSTFRFFLLPQNWDHPRVCGEKTKKSP